MASEEDLLPLYKHPAPHREVMRRYRVHLAQQNFRVSVVLSIITFLISLGINIFAINFASEHASNSVTDIILSNTPIFNVDAWFVYGTWLMIAFITALCVLHPKRIPFTLYSLAVFWIVRSIFTSLTHIGPYPVPIPSGDWSATTIKLFFGGDLFFSGHTGVPFLLALMYWHEPRLRNIFLAWSAFFAVVVLLGHLHYSIDVLSAFFITYTVYHITLWFFPKDRDLFLSETPQQQAFLGL